MKLGVSLFFRIFTFGTNTHFILMNQVSKDMWHSGICIAETSDLQVSTASSALRNRRPCDLFVKWKKKSHWVLFQGNKDINLSN